LKDPVLDIPVAVALAIHNIPEGIAVLIPVYYATGNRSKMKVIL
jgi:ZIP family zinc transporter